MTKTLKEPSLPRRRMIEDMSLRNLSPATQRSYIHAVAKFSKYFKRSPDQFGHEEVRAFQVLRWPQETGQVGKREFRP